MLSSNKWGWFRNRRGNAAGTCQLRQNHSKFREQRRRTITFYRGKEEFGRSCLIKVLWRKMQVWHCGSFLLAAGRLACIWSPRGNPFSCWTIQAANCSSVGKLSLHGFPTPFWMNFSFFIFTLLKTTFLNKPNSQNWSC